MYSLHCCLEIYVFVCLMQMQKIILDLLELSRVGKVVEERGDLDIGTLIEEIKLYMRKSLLEKNASIAVENLPVINSYKTPLLQIFQNLIGNALKYSKKEVSPQITIRGNELEEYWEFSIEDNGIGIDPEYFNKIFVENRKFLSVFRLKMCFLAKKFSHTKAELTQKNL